MRLFQTAATSLFIATSVLACSSSEDTEPGLDAGTSGDANVDVADHDAATVPDATDIDASEDVRSDAIEVEAAVEAAVEASGPRLLATIETSAGTIVVALNPDAAPITVENFQSYADAGYYDGLIFHRVIPDFMIQGGGFEPGMNQRATLFPAIVNESSTSGLSNLRGTISMARTPAPDSATSQFFINTADNKFLDATSSEVGYAVFGAVVEGLDVVDTIESVETASAGIHDDVPVVDVVIESIRVVQE